MLALCSVPGWGCLWTGSGILFAVGVGGVGQGAAGDENQDDLELVSFFFFLSERGQKHDGERRRGRSKLPA